MKLGSWTLKPTQWNQGQVFKSDEPCGFYRNEQNSANQEGHFLIEDDVDENRQEGRQEVVNGDGDQDILDDDVQLLHVELQQQETAERGCHEDDGSKHGQKSLAFI